MSPPDPLRLCAEPGCSARGRHYENCSGCFGFGVKRSESHSIIPVRAADFRNDVPGALPCPTCGSSTAGAPSAAAVA